jgi:hypothetical protein
MKLEIRWSGCDGRSRVGQANHRSPLRESLVGEFKSNFAPSVKRISRLEGARTAFTTVLASS